MKAIKHFIAIIVGLFVFFFSNALICVAIYHLGQIPFLGTILFYPTDAAWSLIVIPATASVYFAYLVSNLIAENSKGTMILIILILFVFTVFMFVQREFSWAKLIRNLFGLGAAIALLADEP